MKLSSTEPFWLLKNGLINSYPSLRENIECDILIVGSGITGALMAYQLSSEGYHAVLIDKRDVATGSTSATTAMIQYEIDEPLYSLIEKVGEDAAVDSYKAGVAAIDKLEMIIKTVKADCGFSRKRSLHIARSLEDLEWLEKEYVARKKYLFEVEWLTKPALSEQYGIKAEGAILSEAGASVDAYCLAHVLLSYCVKVYGLSVYDSTCAEKIEYGKAGNTTTTQDGFIVKSNQIVFASGFETKQMISDHVVNLTSTYAFVSEPLANIPSNIRNTIFWDTQDPYLYMRTTSDNRILVGGGDEEFKNAARRDRLLRKKQGLLKKDIEKLFPAFELIPDFTWAGTFGVTQDALPYIGAHPDYPNSYFLLGFGGNGITFSVMGMSILSDAIAGKENKFLNYFRFNR